MASEKEAVKGKMSLSALERLISNKLETKSTALDRSEEPEERKKSTSNPSQNHSQAVRHAPARPPPEYPTKAMPRNFSVRRPPMNHTPQRQVPLRDSLPQQRTYPGPVRNPSHPQRYQDVRGPPPPNLSRPRTGTQPVQQQSSIPNISRNPTIMGNGRRYYGPPRQENQRNTGPANQHNGGQPFQNRRRRWQIPRP